MGTDTTPRDVIANWLPITDRLAEDPHAVAGRWADALLAALTEAGYVVIERGRVHRLINLAESAEEHIGWVSDALDELEPGDRYPLS